MNAAVSVKLPEIWIENTDAWFAQAEAQFHLAGITSESTKFYHVVSKINVTVFPHISDLLSNPPRNPYEKLKERLLTRFQQSRTSRFEALLSSVSLGEDKPTHLLSKMRALANGLDISDEVLRMLFINKLPEKIRSIAILINDDLDSLATHIDKVIDVSDINVAATSTPTTRDYDELQKQIAALTDKIDSMRVSRVNSNRRRSFSRPRSSNRDSESFCWYHRTYGEKASNCRQPCTFNKQKN